MELDPVPVKRPKETRTWHETDVAVNNRHDTYANTYNKLSTKLSLAIFSPQNIMRIQTALRKVVLLRTKNKDNRGIDIGIQPGTSISNQLAAFYGNLRYCRMGNDIPDNQMGSLVRDINYNFLMEVLVPTVMNGLESKILYNSWALKVADPQPYGHNEKVVDKSVDLHQYHDDSLGGNYSNNDWNWGKMAMYDEPDSLYKRYPD